MTSLLARIGRGTATRWTICSRSSTPNCAGSRRARCGGNAQGGTLQTTALVHEAYLRLVKDASLSAANRGQFLGIAAHAMREILIDRARARVAQKRGGGAVARHARRVAAP